MGALYEEKKKHGHPLYHRARFFSLEEVEKVVEQSGLVISNVKSTLQQRPDQESVCEKPVDGIAEGAGFLCIEAGKDSVKF